MEGFRRAVRFITTIHAAKYIVPGRPLYVVTNKQVQQAVPVIVEPQRRGAEAAAAAQPGFCCHVDESSPAGVVQEAALAYRGNQNIGKSVVVIVGDSHAHAVHLDIESGGAGDIGKRPVAIVAVQVRR